MEPRTLALAAAAVALMAAAQVSAQPHGAPAGARHPQRPVLARPEPLGQTRWQPWVEGVQPLLEDRLFDATYRALPSHNVLKVYVFEAGGYQSAGIRFSARVAHRTENLPASAMFAETELLVRTAFDRFPEISTLDVWGTVPVDEWRLTKDQNTLFSMTADRAMYESIRNRRDLSPEAFVRAFGEVWVSPEAPR